MSAGKMCKNTIFPNTFTEKHPKINLEKDMLCRFGDRVGYIHSVPEGELLLEHILEQANSLPRKPFENNTLAEISLLDKSLIIKRASDTLATFKLVEASMLSAGLSTEMLEKLVQLSVSLGDSIGIYNETTDYLEPTMKLRSDSVRKSKGALKTLEKKDRERILLKNMVECVHTQFHEKMPKKDALASTIFRLIGEASNKPIAKSTVTKTISRYCTDNQISLQRRAECDYPPDEDVFTLLRRKFKNSEICRFLS